MTSKARLFVAQYTELLTVGHLRRRLILSFVLQILQQLTGINAIIFYAPSIFRATGLSGDSVGVLATGVVGVVNFCSTIPPTLFMDRFGRRTLLAAGAVGMSACQLLIGTLYAVYGRTWAEHPAAGWAAAVFVWAFVACFASTIGCVGWIITSEIFPPAVRSKAVGLAISVSWLSTVSWISPDRTEFAADGGTVRGCPHYSPPAAVNNVWDLLSLPRYVLPP